MDLPGNRINMYRPYLSSWRGTAVSSTDHRIPAVPDSLAELTLAIRRFADERDWEQFHSPKNLAMALIVEAAELVEHFQWLNQEESRHLAADQRAAVSLEMADVLIYLLRIADRLDIDLLEAAREKLRINEQRYPAELARGRADKYHRYRADE